MNKTPLEDTEVDNLEGQERRKGGTVPNDPDKIKSYDANIKTNQFESKGSYSLKLVGKEQVFQYKRSAEDDDMDRSELMESSLLAIYNHCESRKMT